MDDTSPRDDNPNVDFFNPEGVGGPGEVDANWKAPVHQEQVPLGGSSETTTSQPKESEWPISEHKEMEVNGKMMGYYETGREDADHTVLNLSGLGAGSGEGNLRLDHALNGRIENSRGMQTLREDLPKGADKVEEMVKNLTGKYRTITPETPGDGFGSEAIDNPTLDNLADHFAEFAKKKGLQNVIIFGSSMGGTLAIRIAARHPELASALALQGVMTEPDDMQKLAYIPARIFTATPIRQMIEYIPGASSIMKKILKSGTKTQPDFRLADEQGKEQMLRDTDKAEAHTYLLALRGIGKDLEEEISQINQPVVLLDGENSVVVSIDKTKRIAGKFHPEISDEDPRENLRKKIEERKVLFYKIGGVTGEHAHSVLNTFPEGMAVMINHAVNYFNAGAPKI